MNVEGTLSEGMGVKKTVAVICLSFVAVAPAFAQNLVRNGGFEEGGSPPSGWMRGSYPQNTDVPVDISTDSSQMKSGRTSLKFAKSENRFFPVALVSQSIGAPAAGKRIKLGAWVKASGARKLAMGVLFVGAPEGEGKPWGVYVGEAKSGDKPAEHDWTHYGSVLAVPRGTTQVVITLEMYGPGTAWIDDVTAEYVSADTPLKAATADKGDEAPSDPLADVKDVPSEEIRADNDPRKRYFLIGAQKDRAEPYRLLVVLPGGDGSAEMNPFMRRVWKNALPEGYLIAQVVAPKWSEDQFGKLVWPTNRVRWATMKFSTEEFVESVIKDVKAKHKIDDSKVFTMSWSSGGPAAYAVSLQSSQVKGSFIAMSVYKPDQLPSLVMAKGHAYYLFHSPEDFISIEMPRLAELQLGEKGAKVTLTTYPGGHGWTSDPFGNIRKGVEWLEKNAGGQSHQSSLSKAR